MITYTESTIHNSPYTNYVKIPYTKNHNHMFWEINIILSGSITHVINDNPCINPAGTVTFLRPLKDSHYFQETNLNEKMYRHRDFFINNEDMEKWCELLSKNLYNDLYKPEQPCSFSIPSTFLNHIESTFFSVNLEQLRNQAVFKNLQFSIVLSLLSSFQLSQSPTAIPPWIKELIQSLKNPSNFSTPIEVLFQTIPYSHCHICREFKKHMGQTAINFFIKQKISYASHLLANTNLKIIDVANIVGYDSPKNFIAQFTKAYQLSPSEWRIKNQILAKK